jgi:peroxiredoxin
MKMRNKIVFTVILSLFLTTLSAAVVPQYRIHGTVTGLKDGTVIYLRLVGPPQKDIDSAIVSKGHYELKGKAPLKPEWVLMSLKGRFTSVADFYLEKGDITIKGNEYKSTVTGTKTNTEYNIYNRDISSLYEEQGRLFYTGMDKDQAFRDSMKLVMAKFSEKVDRAELGYIRKYPASVISLRLLGYKSSHMTGDKLNSAIALLDKSFQNTPEVLNMKAYAKRLLSCAEGTMAPDFTLTATDGSTFTLSAQKGKYVLIDFWASWCQPCRASLPGMAVLNEKYKGKNFILVGLSLDRNDAAWKKALEVEKCTWLQVCDSKGTVASKYAISAIPMTILVSPEGKILNRGLLKDDLSNKLAEIFGN